MKNTLMLGAAFMAGIAVVGGSFAFMGNEEVQSAIDTNDYEAFVQVAPDKMLEKINSEEAFTDFAARKTQMQALHETTKTAVLAAVENNDFDAFIATHEDMQAQMEALRPEDAPEKDRPEMTEEQLQEKFTKLVEYYTENGELPQHRKGLGNMGKRGGHAGDCTGRGEHKGAGFGGRFGGQAE